MESTEAWNLILEIVALRMASRLPPPPPPIPPHAHWLLHLPPAFWARMHRYLDYAEILRLSQLNFEFRAVELHTYLPWRVRHAVVAACELDASAADQGGGQTMQFACYLCFRMLDVAVFPSPNHTASHARVVQREPYTGRRVLEPVARPSAEQLRSMVHPPSPSVVSSLPLSPVWTTGGGERMGEQQELSLQAAAMAAMAAASGSGSRAAALEALRRRRGQTQRLMATGQLQQLFMGPPPSSGGDGGYGGGGLAYPTWWPQAPGAEVGQIESLRRYCVGCGLGAQLLVPGDIFTTRTGAAFWVCQCRHAQPRRDAARCPVCQMHPVYID